MKLEDGYWDDLGVEWRASESDLKHMAPRLHARLRRQSFAIATALALGIPLCGAGIVLGAFTVWQGWATGTWNFVTRGIAIVLISAMLIRALVAFLPLRAQTDSRSLTDMLEIASARIRRTLFLVRLAMAVCVIAAVFGLAGTVIRTHAGSPPRLSPTIDLILIALVLLCLWLYGRMISAEGGKFEYLRRTLAQPDDAEIQENP